MDILSKVSIIHFNSTLSEQIYGMYMTPNQSKVISISNKEINDNKMRSHNFSKRVRFAYLSSASPPYMIVHADGFDRDELSTVFSNTDVVIIPSVWYETFGFTVLEALSYGVPVIVSENVGAKDIVGEGGVIIKAGSVDALCDAIRKFTPEYLCKIRKKIINDVLIKTWSEYLKENQELLYGVG